jgi:hypothetical protein
MLRAIALTAAAALSLAPSASAAQGPASPPPAAAAKPSPAADRLARALTTQASWNETVQTYASSLSTQISGALKAQGGEAPKDVEERVRAGLDRAVAYEELVRLQAQALAGRFSEDELRAIGTFYESPIGKKLVTELPAVSRQVMETVQGRISAALPKIVQDVAPSLAQARPGDDAGAPPAAGAPRKDPPRGVQGRKPPADAPPRP